MNNHGHLGVNKRLPLYVKTKSARRLTNKRYVPVGGYGRTVERFDLEEPCSLEGKVWYLRDAAGANRIVRHDASGMEYQVPSRSIPCSWPDHVYLQHPEKFEDLMEGTE